MDLTRTRVVLRERALIDVFDLALRFLARHLLAYAKTGALVLPPFIFLAEAVARLGGPIAAWVFVVFAATFAQAPFTALASRLVFEDEVSVLEVVGTGVRASPRLFVLRLVTCFGGLIGLAVFMLPGIWLLATTLFVVEVIILEHARPGAALRRSGRLAHRGSAEAIVALMLFLLLELVIVFAADAAGRTVLIVLLESGAPAPVWSQGWSTFALLGYWLFVPYLATARFLVYVDVRTRNEGWDIQTRFTALASRDAPAATIVKSAA